MTDNAESLAVLDRAHLSAMTSGDAELAAEVLGLFQEQADMWGRLLDPRKPAKAWADAAHTLKGAALGVGAMRLARACEATEKLGRSGEASPAQAAVSIDTVRTEMVAAVEAAAAAAYEIAGSGSFMPSKDSNS